MTVAQKSAPKAKAPRKRPSGLPREKKPPYSLPCGCDNAGGRCQSEVYFWDRLAAALEVWKRSGLGPGEEGFETVYRPVLLARRDYQAHFGQRYDMRSDPLLCEHRAGTVRKG